MRRRVPARPIAGRAQAALNHRRDRTLAVRPGDHDAGIREVRTAERAEQRPNLLETELDADLLEREEVVAGGHAEG